MNQVMTYYFWALDNLNYIAILILVFCAVSFAIYGIYYLFLRPSITEQRLKRLVPHEQQNKRVKPKLLEQSDSGFVTKITKPINELISPKVAISEKGHGFV